MKSAVVVGNPKPASRTLAAATYVAARALGVGRPTSSSTWPRSAPGCSTGRTPGVADARRRGRRGRSGRGGLSDVQGDVHRAAQAVPRPVRHRRAARRRGAADARCRTGARAGAGADAAAGAHRDRWHHGPGALRPRQPPRRPGGVRRLAGAGAAGRRRPGRGRSREHRAAPSPPTRTSTRRGCARRSASSRAAWSRWPPRSTGS